jgi:DNA-binding phage protein
MQRFLTAKDVVQLLRQEVAEIGGQSAWARKTGIHRSLINRVLQGKEAPTKTIIDALQLKVVYLPKKHWRG